MIFSVCFLYLFIFIYILFFFFFQAEDGIRDGRVTGVQTCALPISRPARERRLAAGEPGQSSRDDADRARRDHPEGGGRRRPRPIRAPPTGERPEAAPARHHARAHAARMGAEGRAGRRAEAHGGVLPPGARPIDGSERVVRRGIACYPPPPGKG